MLPANSPLSARSKLEELTHEAHQHAIMCVSPPQCATCAHDVTRATLRSPFGVPYSQSSPLPKPGLTPPTALSFDSFLPLSLVLLVPLPPNRSAIVCKWGFRVKENPDGTVNKYKTRLVAKGFHQRLEFSYTETISSIVNPITVRLILTLAHTFKWAIQ